MHFKPARVKRVEGFPGHRKPNTPPVVAPSIPPCPEDLLEAAKAEWMRIAPVLEQHNMLTGLDAAALRGYCICVARLDEAEADISARGLLVAGDRGLVKNPACQLGRQYRTALARYCDLFGFAPGPRGRMNLPAPKPVDDEWAILDLKRK